MLDIFDFIFTPYLHDAICEAIEYEKEEYLMRNYEEFKEGVYVILDSCLENKTIVNGRELMELACELHDTLEGIIQDWADDNNMLDDYIDQI